MNALKVKPEDLVRIVPEGLGDLLDRGVRDVAKILTESEEALRVVFRSTLAHARRACNELDGAQDEPGGRILQDSALQGDRRASSTVAVGDESRMNSYETREDGF